jgi:hypothetical protein
MSSRPAGTALARRIVLRRSASKKHLLPRRKLSRPPGSTARSKCPRTRGLIEDREAGAGHRVARNGGQVPLPLAQPAAPLAEHRAIPLGQLLDEAIRSRQFRRGDHLGVGSLGSAIAKVVQHGIAETGARACTRRASGRLSGCPPTLVGGRLTVAPRAPCWPGARRQGRKEDPFRQRRLVALPGPRRSRRLCGVPRGPPCQTISIRSSNLAGSSVMPSPGSVGGAIAPWTGAR